MAIKLIFLVLAALLIINYVQSAGIVKHNSRRVASKGQEASKEVSKDAAPVQRIPVHAPHKNPHVPKGQEAPKEVSKGIAPVAQIPVHAPHKNPHVPVVKREKREPGRGHGHHGHGHGHHGHGHGHGHGHHGR